VPESTSPDPSYHPTASSSFRGIIGSVPAIVWPTPGLVVLFFFPGYLVVLVPVVFIPIVIVIVIVPILIVLFFLVLLLQNPDVLDIVLEQPLGPDATGHL